MKKELHKLAKDWDKNLHFKGPKHWKISGTFSPDVFFNNLPMVFPYGNTLLFEGLEMSLTAKGLYEEFPSNSKKNVMCDTFSPTPDSFHVHFNRDFAARLCRLIQMQGLESVFYHFKGYSESAVVFTFHDAFHGGDLILSQELSTEVVKAFSDALGCNCEFAEFQIDLESQVMIIDRILNPPWWRRVMRLFQKGKDF